jgi:hypothetical protein
MEQSIMKIDDRPATFNIVYAPKEWLDNLDFQLAISKQKLDETKLKSFSRFTPFGQKERKTYTAIEQLDSSTSDVR